MQQKGWPATLTVFLALEGSIGEETNPLKVRFDMRLLQETEAEPRQKEPMKIPDVSENSIISTHAESTSFAVRAREKTAKISYHEFRKRIAEKLVEKARRILRAKLPPGEARESLVETLERIESEEGCVTATKETLPAEFFELLE